MKRSTQWLVSAAVMSAVLFFSSASAFAHMDGPGMPGGEGGEGWAPCGSECFRVAMEAGAACKEAGGDFMECSKAFMDAMAECKAAAGCETPEQPPACGEECYVAARTASQACQTSDDPRACMAEVKAQLAACLAAADCEVPTPPEHPPVCGEECLKTARAAAEDCKTSEDPEACMIQVKTGLKACLEAAGCPVHERPPVCGEECLKAARESAQACRDAGGDVEACMVAVKEALKACMERAGCPVRVPPEFPPICGLGCLKEACGAARECLQGGGGFRDCAGAFRTALEACRDAAGCGSVEEPPLPPEEEGEVLGLLLEDTFVRGDSNQDGTVDVSDSVVTLRYLFLGDAAPACADAADANDDSAIDIADPVFVLGTLFQGSAVIPAPYPAEGFDPTEDAIVCGM